MACRLVGAKSLSAQCWNIVYWTHGNKHQWYLNRNLYISIKEMHLKWFSGNWRPFSFGLNMLNYWWFRINMFSLISERFQNGLPLRARWLYCTCWSNKHEIKDTGFCKYVSIRNQNSEFRNWLTSFSIFIFLSGYISYNGIRSTMWYVKTLFCFSICKQRW